jgi:hypothetical protein
MHTGSQSGSGQVDGYPSLMTTARCLALESNADEIAVVATKKAALLKSRVSLSNCRLSSD